MNTFSNKPTSETSGVSLHISSAARDMYNRMPHGGVMFQGGIAETRTFYATKEDLWDFDFLNEKGLASEELINFIDLHRNDPDVMQAVDKQMAIQLAWREEKARLAWESRPIELRVGGHRDNLVDIMNGLEPRNQKGYWKIREIEIFRDLKDAPIAVRIANSLAIHVEGSHLQDAGASPQEVAMFGEAAMRIALYIAENHMDERQAGLFMSEMRSIKHSLVCLSLMSTAYASFVLDFSDPRSMNDILNSLPRSATVSTPQTTTTVRSSQAAAAAQNFDTWIKEERFSSVQQWMERIMDDISQWTNNQ